MSLERGCLEAVNSEIKALWLEADASDCLTLGSPSEAGLASSDLGLSTVHLHSCPRDKSV